MLYFLNYLMFITFDMMCLMVTKNSTRHTLIQADNHSNNKRLGPHLFYKLHSIRSIDKQYMTEYIIFKYCLKS